MAGPAGAQVAGGSTTVDTRVVASTRIAMGWSVKRTLMGKTVHDDAGRKVGRVDDLIVAPDGSVSYVIIGAGGFVGIGRHDVAVPVAQLRDTGGKLVMPGATRDTIRQLPEFVYATDTGRRDAFVAAADDDIARGKAALEGLERKAGAASAEARQTIDLDIASLQSELKSAEAGLAAMKQATAVRWREFEADLDTATARLRKATGKATG
ncbi:MAG: PRC-barrel domain containing protein [Burkholderiales bacterium]|nr:MAG: PRC-barrel domain containing protein [Burkholderiales bacterium]